MLKHSFITSVQLNGKDVTPLVASVNGVPVVQPVKLPRESVATTPERMEPREIRFIDANSVHLDEHERLWTDAEAFTLPLETDRYCVRIMRTEQGVHMDIPKNIGYAPRRKCPFEHTLPVLAIAIVDIDDFEDVEL